MDGSANPLMDGKVVGVVHSQLLAVVWYSVVVVVVCIYIYCSCICSCSVIVVVVVV